MNKFQHYDKVRITTGQEGCIHFARPDGTYEIHLNEGRWPVLAEDMIEKIGELEYSKEEAQKQLERARLTFMNAQIIVQDTIHGFRANGALDSKVRFIQGKTKEAIDTINELIGQVQKFTKEVKREV